MKKYLFILSVAAVAAIACSKEETFNQEENIIESSNSGEKYVLFAELPQFTDADTKAAVSDAGVFSWTLGDVINVALEKSGSGYIYREFTCTNDATGEFTYEGAGIIPEGYNPRGAYYPASYTGTPSSQTFASPEAAAKGFQMEATVSAGKLKFSHENAMMKVTINNVPSFAKQIVVGGTTINVSYDSNPGNVTYYVPMAPAAAAKLSIAVKDGNDNNIITKTSGNSVAITAANFYNLPNLTIDPIVDIKLFATSWEKAYVYLFDGEGYIGTAWGDLGSVMKKYNDGSYDHYYRVLPAAALGQTYGVIVFNSADDTYRIRTSITIENQNYYSASQKEGLRKVGDNSYRFILRDEPLGTDKDSNPDTYLYIKSITGVDGSGFTGSWESDETKALGWFIGKRSGYASGRYYYFDIDALKSYDGSWFVYEYTMYKEGDHTNQWREVYNVSYESGISSYIHVGYWSNSGDSGTYIDNDFDSQMSE